MIRLIRRTTKSLLAEKILMRGKRHQRQSMASMAITEYGESVGTYARLLRDT